MTSRIAFATTFFLLAATPALSQTRPMLPTMTCAAAAAMVQQSGSMMMSTGTYGFDRFVANPGICGRDGAVPAYTATRDNPACLVGYRCGGARGK